MPLVSLPTTELLGLHCVTSHLMSHLRTARPTLCYQPPSDSRLVATTTLIIVAAAP
jgi:hypothetical protein